MISTFNAAHPLNEWAISFPDNVTQQINKQHTNTHTCTHTYMHTHTHTFFDTLSIWHLTEEMDIPKNIAGMYWQAGSFIC